MAVSPNEALVRRAQRLGIDEWPYGVNSPSKQEQMLDWAERYNFKLANTSQRCVHWLIAGQSPDIMGRYAKDGSARDSLGCGKKYGFDHVTCWTQDGRRAVIVYQPYSLTIDHLYLLGELEHEGLDVFVHGKGWYGSGTLCVEIWGIKRH